MVLGEFEVIFGEEVKMWRSEEVKEFTRLQDHMFTKSNVHMFTRSQKINIKDEKP